MYHYYNSVADSDCLMQMDLPNTCLYDGTEMIVKDVKNTKSAKYCLLLQSILFYLLLW